MGTKRIQTTVRTAAAVLSAAITLTLFNAVVSVSEPQHSRLMAVVQARQAGTRAVQLASTSTSAGTGASTAQR